MSWDATLTRSDTGEDVADWNFTHNCNVMANLVLYPDTDTSRTTFQEVFTPQDPSWWKCLHGMDGRQGAEFLGRIVTGMRADPDRYRKLNPDNGWGDYDAFLAVLEEMRAAVPAGTPTRWSVVG